MHTHANFIAGWEGGGASLIDRPVGHNRIVPLVAASV